MVRRGLGLTMMAVAAAAIGATTARAAASDVTCGETITHNVTLVADLDCASTPALRIGAAGITLNLNGHEILAGFTGTATKPVIVDNGVGSVTIENGQVYPFGGLLGIRLKDANNVDLVNLDSSSNTYPLTISGGSGDVITNSTLSGNGGVTVDGSDDLQLADDDVDGGAEVAALTLDHVDNAVIVNSGFAGGTGVVSVLGSDNLIEGQSSDGIEVVGGSGNTIHGVDVGFAGITVDAAATGTLVHGNIVSGGAIDVAGPDTRITGNTASGPWVGIDVSGLDASILSNTVDHDSSDGFEVSGSGARILDNTADEDDQDGIEVSGPAALINGNTTSDNQLNGLEVTDPTARIDHNTADDNTLFGITAVVGDTGGSNSASGNNSVGGVPGEQCLNVECEAGSS